MSYLKDEAIEICNNLNQRNEINYNDYSTIFDAICQIDTLKERDEQLEALWKDFGNVPFNPDAETIEEDFLSFPAGTDREEIWHWFDERHSKGVAYLLYKTSVGRCYVLLSRNYADGEDTEVFYNKDDAKRSARTEMLSVKEELKKQGYSPVTMDKYDGNYELYVPDTDIYYEWEIVPSEVHA